jgi:hypothetical protein
MINKNIQEADQAAQITPAVVQQRVKKGLTILTGVPADSVVISPTEPIKKFQTEEKPILERVVNLMQRRKKAAALRRRMPKMEIKRKIAKTRLASKEKLMQRAMRMAKQQIRKRVAGARGANYKNLNPSQKIAIDKMVERRAASIKVMATRMMPRVRQGEMKRLKAVQTHKSTKGVYGNIPLNQEYTHLFSNLIGEQITKDELNQLFSMYEGKFGQAVKSVVTSPIRAVGTTGKLALGTVAAAAAAPSIGTPRGVRATGAVVTGLVATGLNKLSKVGKPNQPTSNTAKPVQVKSTNTTNTTNTTKKTIVSHKEWDYEAYLQEKITQSLLKKADKYGVSFEEVASVYNKGLEEYTESNNTPQQFAMQRVNSHLAEEVKKTSVEKFKAGLKKAGYDPDAGAKRLMDLIAKQKKERAEFETKYKSAYEEVSLDESFIVDRAAGYSTTYTAADLGIKIQGGFALHPSVTEEDGAGDEGTNKLVNKYKKDTPGESVEAFMRQMRAKRKANIQC